MENKKYKLSKDAIKYLDDIIIQNKTQSIKSIIIKSNFIFKIDKIEKIKKGIYSSTLLDNDFKSDKFILNFEKEELIPKKGDYIEIEQIEKSYNEEKKINIYECSNINIITKEFINVDNSKIENYDNKIYNGKNIIEKKTEKNKRYLSKSKNIDNFEESKKSDSEDEEEEEDDEEEEEDDKDEDNNIVNNNNNNENTLDKNIHINNKINNYEEKKINQNEIKNGNQLINYKNQENNNNFLSISDLNINSKNFNIYIKCIEKEEIQKFRNKKNQIYQKYIFSDINSDKIEGISFNDDSRKLDKIIKINEIYEVSNCNILLNKKNCGMVNSPFKILFSEYMKITNISHKEYMKNKFKDKNEILNNNNPISISNIINKNVFEIISIFCFVLKDFGNSKFNNKYNVEYYGRKLLLGDDSNYKIEIIFWHSKELKEIYNEGELLYIQNAIIKEFNNKKNLCSTKYLKIQNSYNKEYDDKLKKYYSEHKNIQEYFETKANNECINDNNKNSYGFNYYNLTYVKLIFIKDILTKFNNENKINEDINFKISAVVKSINHSNKNYYYGCYNCKKKMLTDICQNCGNKNKIIILHYSVLVVDCSSSLWLLLFGDIAESFIGITGEEYKNIIDKGISKENIELNLLNEKIKNKEYIFMGKSQYYSYYKYKGYRFPVRYFAKKTKKQYYSLVYYLKSLFK